jgi:uncharacterized protein YacL
VLNNIIKVSFSIVGAVTGYTLTHTFFLIQKFDMPYNFRVGIYCLVTVIAGLLFFSTGGRIIEVTIDLLDRIEHKLQKMTLYELSISAAGLVVGLIIANHIAIPVNKVAVIGVPLSIFVNILFASIGVGIVSAKKNENILDSYKNRGDLANETPRYKIVDTSVIIDGRIADICRTGFMEGILIVPGFVLEELRHIADSSDALKRNRGRRGLDVLNLIQKELNYPVTIDNTDFEGDEDVDARLLKTAQKYKGAVITNDYNLNKVALIKGVTVLNINELANAVKPIALPGEEMTVQVIKDGKENGQGIGYMNDGTMIVVEGGRKYIGGNVNITVTSVLQTAAGRMIFAKPKA